MGTRLRHFRPPPSSSEAGPHGYLCSPSIKSFTSAREMWVCGLSQVATAQIAKTSSAITTIAQTGYRGSHRNMLTIDSEAMMIADTRAHGLPDLLRSLR